MQNLLITTNDYKEHYYSIANKGIYLRKNGKRGILEGEECIAEDVKGAFWVYRDSSEVEHILHVDSENRMIYTTIKGEEKHNFVISSINSEINVFEIRIYSVSGRQNLLYSAAYNDEILLVHCILGNNAKPQTVNKLLTPHFWVYNNKVYYTDKEGRVCFSDLSDEKPDTYEIVSEAGRDVSAYDMCGEDVIIFIDNSRLYINGKEIIYDSRMEMPTLSISGGVWYLMWRSGGYVRYMTSDNGGKSWSGPMRFMASGAEIRLFYEQKNDNIHLYYGYNTPYGCRLFKNPDMM